MSERWRDWAPEAAVALAVLVVGLVEVWATLGPFQDPRPGSLLVVIGFAVACGLSRRAPFAALVVVWTVCAVQLLLGIGVMTVEFSIAIVAFGCARWEAGRRWRSAGCRSRQRRGSGC